MLFNQKRLILFFSFAALIAVSLGYFILKNSLNEKGEINVSELSINSRALAVRTNDNAISSAREVSREIEDVHCKTAEEDLINKEKLNKDDLKKVKAFCGLSRREKEEFLTVKFNELEGKKNSKEGRIVARSNSYACFYGVSLNYGIPNYADIGLSSSSCNWHDSAPFSCKNEGGVACLWGCTNNDPNLGWHKKWFASTADLEREVYSKGYAKLSTEYGGDYSRAIGYGYRWQVFSDGGGWWHSEGPEPNSAFNWYAFLRDWWPLETRIWHGSC